MRKKILGSVAVVAAASAAVVPTAMAAQASGGRGGAPVVVTNTSASPVPVSGTVDVGNLPSSQTVNGQVGVTSLPPVSGSVAVDNFPSSQAVTGTVGIDPGKNTVQIGGTPTVAIDPGHNAVASAPFTNVVIASRSVSQSLAAGVDNEILENEAVADYRELRLSVYCLDVTTGGKCSAVHVSLMGLDGDYSDFMVDEYLPGQGRTEHVVELPGPRVLLHFINFGDQPVDLGYALVGRSN